MNRIQQRQIAGAAIIALVAGGMALVVGADRKQQISDNSKQQAVVSAPIKDTEKNATAQSAEIKSDGKEIVAGLLLPEVKDHRRGDPWGDDYNGWMQRRRRFLDLYIARHERDVVPELIPFLEDEDEHMRNQAAQILGELEDARAEASLQAKLRQVETYNARLKKSIEKNPNDDNPLLHEKLIGTRTLKLALGRIRSRDLHGLAKLNKVAQSIDLTYDEVIQLTQRLEALYTSQVPAERRQAAQSPAKEVALEFVNLLHDMGRRGEDIQNLKADKMAFGPLIEMRLRGATMPLDEEIKMVLDHATSPQGGVFDPLYLLGLGPRAVEMLVQRLKDIAHDPAKYHLGEPQALNNGYVQLFRAAALTGDPRVIPLLEQLTKHSNSKVRSYAEQTLHVNKGGILPERNAKLATKRRSS